MNIMFVASDNNCISGAFLSMAKLAQILIRDYRVNVFVVLPNVGDGGKLLDAFGVGYEIVPSRNWVVDIEEGKTQEMVFYTWNYQCLVSEFLDAAVSFYAG